jgi:hypothetical protein
MIYFVKHESLKLKIKRTAFKNSKYPPSRTNNPILKFRYQTKFYNRTAEDSRVLSRPWKKKVRDSPTKNALPLTKSLLSVLFLRTQRPFPRGVMKSTFITQIAL